MNLQALQRPGPVATFSVADTLHNNSSPSTCSVLAPAVRDKPLCGKGKRRA